MNVLITNQEKSSANGRTYETMTGICENREVQIMKVSGKSNYVNITVKNASHKAWRGRGKDFETIQDALNNYKCEKIKAIIEMAL